MTREERKEDLIRILGVVLHPSTRRPVVVMYDGGNAVKVLDHRLTVVATPWYEGLEYNEELGKRGVSTYSMESGYPRGHLGQVSFSEGTKWGATTYNALCVGARVRALGANVPQMPIVGSGICSPSDQLPPLAQDWWRRARKAGFAYFTPSKTVSVLPFHPEHGARGCSEAVLCTFHDAPGVDFRDPDFSWLTPDEVSDFNVDALRAVDLSGASAPVTALVQRIAEVVGASSMLSADSGAPRANSTRQAGTKKGHSMLIVHPDSHVHSDLLPEHVAWALNKFKNRDGFFKESVEMPKSLPALNNALYGPTAGDPPVAEADVVYIHRPGGKSRLGKSRMVHRPMRKTRVITVIAGPHDGYPMVVYAMHGGHPAEREPFDEDIETPAQQAAADAFWATHALATGEATPARHRTRANNTMTDSVNAPRHTATVLGGGLHDQGAWVLLRVSPAYKGHRFVIASGSEGYYPDGEVAVFPADVNSRITGNILAGPFRGDTRLWRVLPKMLGFDITPNTPE